MTVRGGVRPGMLASPENEEHWAFPRVELTVYKKRLIVATVVTVLESESNPIVMS
jgi:hypothetical protein